MLINQFKLIKGYRCKNKNCELTLHKKCLQFTPKNGCPASASDLSNTFAAELNTASSFGLLGPTNPKEATVMSHELESKLIQEMNFKHKQEVPKMYFTFFFFFLSFFFLILRSKIDLI